MSQLVFNAIARKAFDAYISKGGVMPVGGYNEAAWAEVVRVMGETFTPLEKWSAEEDTRG